MTFGRSQQTLASVCQVSGRGYWSGKPITLTFQPAPIDTGIVFRRTDLPNVPSLKAIASNRRDTPLRTRLLSEACSFDMIEHVMATLYAMNIDNCFVDCSAQEMPGMDGSALAFALAIESAGVQLQTTECQVFAIDAPYRLGDDQQWIMAFPTTDNSLECEYRLDYGVDSPIKVGTYRSSIHRQAFVEEIAPARTFVLKPEAEQLQARGMARHVTFRDLLVFDSEGPIDNSLRYDDECARHKLLDLVGDLALSGIEIHGKIVAYRSGHILNGHMAQWLGQQAIKAKFKNRTPLLSRSVAA